MLGHGLLLLGAVGGRVWMSDHLHTTVTREGLGVMLRLQTGWGGGRQNNTCMHVSIWKWSKNKGTAAEIGGTDRQETCTEQVSCCACISCLIVFACSCSTPTHSAAELLSKPLLECTTTHRLVAAAHDAASDHCSSQCYQTDACHDEPGPGRVRIVVCVCVASVCGSSRV